VNKDDSKGRRVAFSVGPALETPSERVESSLSPPTAEDALRLAIKLAVDKGDLDRAGALLDVAKRTKARPVTALDVVRARRDDAEGNKR
jgi:hypothetical protein